MPPISKGVTASHCIPGWSNQIIILGICGRRGHGKDTLAGFLADHGYKRAAFADRLKDTATRLFDLSYRQAHGSVTEKETPDPRWTTVAHPEGLTPRFILQQLGTEVARTIHPDVWARALLHDIAAVAQGLSPDAIIRFAVSDVRFPNEVDAIRACGGKIVKVVRKDYAVDAAIDAHASESSIDLIDPDYMVVAASGEMGVLREAAAAIARDQA